MSTKNRRPLVSSTSSSLVKKKYPSSEDSDKITAAKQQLGKPQMAKKRPALVPISNQRNAPQSGPRTSVASKPMAPRMAKITKLKNVSSTSTRRIDVSRTTLPAPMAVKSNAVISHKNTTLSKSDRPKAPVVALPDLSSLVTALPAISSMDVSPRKIDDGSVSLDETMSTCDSLRSPEFEYIDNGDASAVSFIKRKPEIAGNIFRRVPVVETNEEVVDIDNNVNDPQFCATIACDIYKHLRACEIKKMPAPDYMERIQISINASMRGILIDWLVEVSEEYSLLPETLYLTVNYIDRYLSRYVIKRDTGRRLKEIINHKHQNHKTSNMSTPKEKMDICVHEIDEKIPEVEDGVKVSKVPQVEEEVKVETVDYRSPAGEDQEPKKEKVEVIHQIHDDPNSGTGQGHGLSGAVAHTIQSTKDAFSGAGKDTKAE